MNLNSDFKSILIAGYVAPPSSPQQLRAVETIMKTSQHFPDWLEVVDTRKSGCTPEALVPILRDRKGSCVAIPVCDQVHLEWASALSRSIKNCCDKIQTVVAMPDSRQGLGSVLESWPSWDAAIPLKPLLLSTTPQPQDAQFPAWRLASSTFVETLLGISVGRPFHEIDGIVYRAQGGQILSREGYRPSLFGDEYFEGWMESTAVDADDQATAAEHQASLLYGELTESGGAQMLSEKYCDVQSATILYELGMGTGRLALQAFASYSWLQKVVGVELSRQRFLVAAGGARKFAQAHGYRLVEQAARLEVIGGTPSHSRRLEFVNGDLFDVPISELKRAEILLILAEVPHLERLDALVNSLNPGTRLGTLEDLSLRRNVCVQAIPEDRTWLDGFETSFNPNRYYYAWRLLAPIPFT